MLPPSPPTGNDTGQISKVHMSWTVSLGIFWASSLLYVSCPFHSALKKKIGKGKRRVSVLLLPSAPLPSPDLGKKCHVCMRSWIWGGLSSVSLITDFDNYPQFGQWEPTQANCCVLLPGLSFFELSSTRCSRLLSHFSCPSPGKSVISPRTLVHFSANDV